MEAFRVAAGIDKLAATAELAFGFLFIIGVFALVAFACVCSHLSRISDLIRRYVENDEKWLKDQQRPDDGDGWKYSDLE